MNWTDRLAASGMRAWLVQPTLWNCTTVGLTRVHSGAWVRHMSAFFGSHEHSLTNCEKDIVYFFISLLHKPENSSICQPSAELVDSTPTYFYSNEEVGNANSPSIPPREMKAIFFFYVG